jgi:hypothetical protein
MREKGRFFVGRAFLLLVVAVLMILAGRTGCQAVSVVLQWNPNSDPVPAGYKVYYKSESSSLPFDGTGAVEGDAPLDVKSATSASVSGLDPAHGHYFAVTAYNAAGIESSYSNIVSIPEMLSPSATISYPVNASTVTGVIPITAGASDNVGVTRVVFHVNGAFAGEDTFSPYVYSWDTSTLPAGTYTLTAKAYDAAGNEGVSDAVTVTVARDSAPPTVSLTAPAANSTISGTVSIAANASDDTGVNYVEFYINSALVSVSNILPYSYSWNTTSVANGSYTISAKAYDLAGNIGQSGTVSVNVSNVTADTSAPTVTIQSPAANASLSATTTVKASATDNVKVTKMVLFIDGVRKATSSSGTISYTLKISSLRRGAHVIKVDAYDAANNVGSESITVYR